MFLKFEEKELEKLRERFRIFHDYERINRKDYFVLEDKIYIEQNDFLTDAVNIFKDYILKILT